ncbi:hypothetical protein HU735_17530 [Pseudomonas sp. BW16M2]|uniref:hypothetical protein n=1 Tax=Pseudomonas sp. BW16M2 TaxID=2745489 RepID=UPI0016440986|nr:hypothetical protein [Pseudomonas sp. BW16M2]MBC3437220.1 hypothetical protein [Pseudomonas sp. BW16M2]
MSAKVIFSQRLITEANARLCEKRSGRVRERGRRWSAEVEDIIYNTRVSREEIRAALEAAMRRLGQG